MRAPVPSRAALRREHEDRSASDGAEIDGRGRALMGSTHAPLTQEAVGADEERHRQAVCTERLERRITGLLAV
jgi:hypothetical protein